MRSKPSYRARLAVYLIPLGLFAVVATTALLLARGYSFDFAAISLRKTGLIVLDSRPQNAYVTVNDQVERSRTRSTLKLSPGIYDVKVDMPDAHPWQKQIRLEPGQAVFEEHILLFRTDPGRTVLTPAAPSGQSLSPSGQELAFLVPAGNEVSLSIAETAGQDPPRPVAALPPGYAAPRSLSWSGDGSRVVISAGDETRVIAVSDGRTLTFGVGGRAAVAPQRSSTIIVEPEPGRLVRATAEPEAATEPYESGVTAWTVSGSSTYVALADGALIKRGGDDRRIIGRGTVLADLTTAPEGGRVFGRGTDGTLYVLENDRLERIGEGTRYAASRDGAQLTYLAGGELRLWDREKRTDRLVTRFAEPPDHLAVVPGGYYVLYDRGGELHAIAADGSNDTLLTERVDLVGTIDREHVLTRDQTSGRIVTLTTLDR